jgi:organic radical activating enzyme
MVEKYIKNNTCVLPWTHLEIDVNGSASPCCLYKGTIENYKVYETDLSTIQKSPYMENLRQQFRNNERPSGCENCWKEEDAGKVSKRMNSIYKMKNSLNGWNTDSEPTLKFIDFKLGNVCNLKCRICGSWSSSKWAQEELDYGPNPLAQKQLREGGWPKKNPAFFDDIQPILKDVEFFEFTGGEPFMIHNHFKILKHCVDKGYAKHQDIHYNTNGTQLPNDEIFEMLSKFKHVEVAFSIDDVGEQFEYQRHPAKWKEVNLNIKQWKDKNPGNIDFQICSTVNIFNIFSLAKLAIWVKHVQPKFFYVNTCFDPDYFCVQTLPQQVKNIATERYGNIAEFKGIIDFMNSSDRYSDQIQLRRKERILLADKYRKENFAETFPTLNSLLGIYD